jgi:hypothetical protein
MERVTLQPEKVWIQIDAFEAENSATHGAF